MSDKSLVIVNLCLLSACAHVPRQPPLALTLAPVQQRVAADCQNGRFSGVVAVRHRDRGSFVYACGYADAERRRQLPAGGRYKLFSTSKIFTAALVLRLAEQGRLELDQPITTYLPDAPANWSSVTIRHLLQHQSGIPDLTENLLEPYKAPGTRTHAAAMEHVLTNLSAEESKLAISPGGAWKYSNFGYELLAQAAATASGLPFNQALERHVIRPARMRSTIIELPDPDRALQSLRDEALIPGFVGDAQKWEPATSYSFVQQGAGALHSTYADLLAFDSALSRGLVLSKEMHRRNSAESVPIKEGVRYGFGWMIRTVDRCTYWQHSGGTNGYTSEFARAPDGEFAVVVLSNLGFAPVSEIRQELVTALIAEGGCNRSPAN